MTPAVAETIEIDVPRRGIGSDLTEALASRGLTAELVDSDEGCALHVRFAADERERLLDDAIGAIEAYCSDRMLPFVVQRANRGAVVRPPADENVKAAFEAAFKWTQPGSNRRPPPCHGGALPAELWAQATSAV